MTEESPSRIPAPRQTLAMRLAERERQRRLRAERLARLRAAPPGLAEDPALDACGGARPRPGGGRGRGGRPRGRGGGARGVPAGADRRREAPRAGAGARAGAAAVLHFQRPPASPGAPERDLERDLDRLPGAGPGLVWALERAGLCRLADIAPLAPEELAAKLGPLGRLVPAQAWIDAARAAPPA